MSPSWLAKLLRNRSAYRQRNRPAYVSDATFNYNASNNHIDSAASVENECDRRSALAAENVRFRRVLPELPSVCRPVETAAETCSTERDRFNSPIGRTSHGEIIRRNDPRLPRAQYSAICSASV
jgi:hypothetical protein